MGIWGDLVKRSKPAPTPNPELGVTPVPVPLPEENLTPAALQQNRGAASGKRAGRTVGVEYAPPPLVNEVASTVVVTSALSRPLVLATPTDTEKQEAAAVEQRRRVAKANPVKKLPATEAVDENPLPDKAQMDANLALLLARLKEPATPQAPERTATPAYTPEQVVSFLSGLPGHLSQESRFNRMTEVLREISPDDTALAAEIVGEAAVKLVELRRNLSTRQTVFNSQVKAEKKQIDQLEAEIKRLRAEVAEKERVFQEQRQEALTQVDEMTGVIVFFDSYQAHRMQVQEEGSASEEGDFVPAYMREDTAERLLGLKDNTRV